MAKCSQMYQNLMKEAMQDESVDVAAAHDESILVALTVFNDSSVGKDTNYKADKEKRLIQKLMQRFHVFQKRVEDKQKDLQEILEEVKKVYLHHMRKVKVDEYLVESELQSMHNEAKSAAMAPITNIIALRGKEPFVQLCKQKVKELLEEEFKCLLDKNNCTKLEAENQLIAARKSLAADYYEAMIHDEYVDDQDLHKIHGEAKEKALKNFYSFKTEPLEVFEKNMKELEEDIKRYFEIIMRKNTNRGEFMRQKLNPFYDKLTVDYLDKMYEVARKRYSNNIAIQEIHKCFKAALLQEIETVLPFNNMQQETIKICSDILEENFEQLEITPNKDGSGGISGYVMKLGAAIGSFIGLTNLQKTFEENMNASCLPSIIFLRGLKIGK
uniref:Uncharacterized protein n=1 Tax=Ciona savignyi TaxID=51511 RepID=H2ZF54_CIOSA